MKRIFFVVFMFFTILTALCQYWSLPPIAMLSSCTRFVAVFICAEIYDGDIKTAEQLSLKAKTHCLNDVGNNSENNRRLVETQIPGVAFERKQNGQNYTDKIPFVFEDMNTMYLSELRSANFLDRIVRDSETEYEAMLDLAAWVGTRWDHGIGELPLEGYYDPSAILSSASHGKKYWCEVAAIFTVQAATSLGWPARLVAAHRIDGHRHAVAELWSNEFAKWFVVDADYNLVYEVDGVPLSAFELCHNGQSLQSSGQLTLRRFAPLKASLESIDLIPFYRYIHIDLRNDWYSRKLRRGSPAGGDLATWWTARPSLKRLLTAKVRVDSERKFNWPVNIVSIRAVGVKESKEGSSVLEIALSAYAPYFDHFQISLDNDLWKDLESCRYEWSIKKGRHCLRTRVVTLAAFPEPGPINEVCYQR